MNMFTPSPEMQRIIQDDLPEDVKPIVEKAVTESENIATRLIQDFEQQFEQKLEAYERRTEEAVKSLTSALDNLVDEAEKNADAMKEHHGHLQRIRCIAQALQIQCGNSLQLCLKHSLLLF